MSGLAGLIRDLKINESKDLARDGSTVNDHGECSLAKAALTRTLCTSNRLVTGDGRAALRRHDRQTGGDAFPCTLQPKSADHLKY
jgi:hypothetical protein